MASTRTGYVGRPLRRQVSRRDTDTIRSTRLPFLLKPLYIVRRPSIASNGESTQASAKENWRLIIGAATGDEDV
jgi:hypothetical protein